MNTFSSKLEYQREKYNLTKEDLADKLDISRQTLYNYLGGRNPNWELLQNIQKVFPNLSMDYWINDSISQYDDFINYENKISEVKESIDEYSEAKKFSIINNKLDTILKIITNSK